MQCPSCGCEVPAARFCGNCGAALPAETDAVDTVGQVDGEGVVEAPLDSEEAKVIGSKVAHEAVQGVAEAAEPTVAIAGAPSEMGPTAAQATAATAPQGEPEPPRQGTTSPDLSGFDVMADDPATLPGTSYARPYNPDITLQMPAVADQKGGNAYSQAVNYTATTQETVPNTAFVLAIIGLILAFSGIGFVIGLILCIVALVLNSKYSKSNLPNPHKTSTTVLSVIGIVLSVLSLIATMFLGVFALRAYDVYAANGFDPNKVQIVFDDKTGEVRFVGESGASGSSSSVAAPSPTVTAPAVNAEYNDTRCFDSFRNPTLYALLELNGGQLQQSLENVGFEYRESDKTWYAKASLLCAEDKNGSLTREQIDKVGIGGIGQAMEYDFCATGYNTSEAALKQLCSDVVLEEYATGVGYAGGLVHGTNQDEHLVLVYDLGGGQHMFFVFTRQAIEAGMFNEALGHNAGNTIDDAWAYVRAM